jgi:hypothetical protein
MEINLTDAIKFLRPNSQFVLKNDDYSTIEWHVLDGEPPSENEVAAALEQVKINKVAEIAAEEAARQAVLDKLGLTAEDLQALGL